MANIACIDLFCGAGGLTHGLVLEGIDVTAGVDVDPACRYPFETNNQGARFLKRDVRELEGEELNSLFGESEVRLLAGCAPCQPFSTYAQRYDIKRDHKWGLLYEFSRLAEATTPDLVTMENVPSLAKNKVFLDFVEELERLGYRTHHEIVDCSKYGVPQTRRRLVLLASRHGDIRLVPPTTPEPRTVQDVIGHLPRIKAGEALPSDPLHTASSLSDINLKRIRASKPGGSWKDWPEHLVAACHRSKTGSTYPSVYGRMEWGRPAPTMTTQCHGYGNGRFGHPSQDRAISLREAAILQSFPETYKFAACHEDVSFSTLARLIGNAVPVELGRAVGKSVWAHLESLGLAPVKAVWNGGSRDTEAHIS
ncbi:DNA cytosine methyltransferase [Billgrantia sulfidoxydans]|uniref:DNA (cytosine-5-)-methyltransferase n=1 Tax=Billgrantia sulfidoxydans TaxID=2733484 RepID=A0ABX7W918_9GAMM|nr:DNA cytosine methyltransferase [Halomonas sulfidoxydans]QTP56325.1 DNA cytosine methyltransferase [Halomonas sulfidoxydans]